MLDVLIDSLLDFWLCRGDVGKWIIERLLNIAIVICLAVAYLGFKMGWYVLGVIGAAGMIYFLILDSKFTEKRIKEMHTHQTDEKKATDDKEKS